MMIKSPILNANGFLRIIKQTTVLHALVSKQILLDLSCIDYIQYCLLPKYKNPSYNEVIERNDAIVFVIVQADVKCHMRSHAPKNVYQSFYPHHGKGRFVTRQFYVVSVLKTKSNVRGLVLEQSRCLPVPVRPFKGLQPEKTRVTLHLDSNSS